MLFMLLTTSDDLWFYVTNIKASKTKHFTYHRGRWFLLLSFSSDSQETTNEKTFWNYLATLYSLLNFPFYSPKEYGFKLFKKIIYPLKIVHCYKTLLPWNLFVWSQICPLYWEHVFHFLGIHSASLSLVIVSWWK